MTNRITFPNAVSATAAVVGFNAALAAGAAAWPTNEQTYFVNEAVPTISFFQGSVAEVTDEEFAREIASVFTTLSDGQEPLGTEFEAVWDANVDKLYQS